MYLVLVTRYLVPGTWYLVPARWHLVPGILYLYLVPDARHQAPDTMLTNAPTQHIYIPRLTNYRRSKTQHPAPYLPHKHSLYIYMYIGLHTVDGDGAIDQAPRHIHHWALPNDLEHSNSLHKSTAVPFVSWEDGCLETKQAT